MEEGIKTGRNRYGDLRICYHASGKYEKRGDNNLKYKFSQKDEPDIYVQGILEFIYHIQCNLFHGKKEINAIQEAILSPSVILLERIVNIVYDELTRELKFSNENRVTKARIYLIRRFYDDFTGNY